MVVVGGSVVVVGGAVVPGTALVGGDPGVVVVAGKAPEAPPGSDPAVVETPGSADVLDRGPTLGPPEDPTGAVIVAPGVVVDDVPVVDDATTAPPLRNRVVVGAGRRAASMPLPSVTRCALAAFAASSARAEAANPANIPR